MGDETPTININKMSTSQLKTALRNQYRKEETFQVTIDELKKEIHELKERLETISEPRREGNYDPTKNLDKRIVNIERRMNDQEQYSRRECIELVGLPDETNGEDLEDMVVKSFKTAGVNVTQRDFHAIHRMKNKKVVIAKLVNRRDAINSHVR